ncbi:MAG: hypothetical protein HPY71_00605 [Firmicutes bacterium]|nr:hypothetical protein [Bacillota bacterium]
MKRNVPGSRLMGVGSPGYQSGDPGHGVLQISRDFGGVGEDTSDPVRIYWGSWEI